MLIDTHCHLDFESFDPDREEVIAHAAAFGVERIIVPALDLENIPAVLRLAGKYPTVFAASGIHPNSAANWQDEWLEAVGNAAAHPKVVAIGEIGLDYYWDTTPPAIQQHAFSAQLAMAAELELPVIIHNRDASADVIRLLAASSLSARANPGVLHSFSASWETAEAALEMGFYLGFTGPVTFKKAEELRNIAARVPLDRILVETDAPFLAPEPRRGRRNEPAYVSYVAGRIAEIRGLSSEEFARQTTQNAVTLFGQSLTSSDGDAR